jgi:DnaJ-class molecular chaperone
MTTSNISIHQLHSNYKNIAKSLHPDLNPEKEIEEFQLLQDVYKTIPINYYTTIHISLQEALDGCERFYVSEDNTKYLLRIPKIAKEITIIFKNVNGDNSIVHAKLKIDIPNNYRLHNGYLIQKINVSMWKLLFGGEILIETIDGLKIRVNVVAGTKKGSIFKILNIGLWDNGRRNPLYIQLI